MQEDEASMRAKLSQWFRDSSDAVTVGVVGSGWVSTHFHLPVLSQMDGVTLSYVADIHENAARQASRTYGATPITITESDNLPRTDVALLATPVGARETYLETFGDRGTAVFSEKPFATNTETHRRYLELVDEVSCNYMRTWYSSTNQLKNAVQSDFFGPLRRVELHEGEIVGSTGQGSDTFRTNVDKSGGGVLMEEGCHLLSQLDHIFEGWDQTVEHTEIKWHEGLDVDLRSEITIENDEVSVPIEYRKSMIEPIGNRARFYFEGATMSVDPFEPGAQVKLAEPVTETARDRPGAATTDGSYTIDPDNSFATEYRQAVYLGWLDFLDAIEGHREADPAQQTRLDVTELMTDMYASATRGREGET